MLIYIDVKFEFGISGGVLINLWGEMIGFIMFYVVMDYFESLVGFVILIDVFFL